MFRYQESLEIARECGKARTSVGAWCLRISVGKRKTARLRYIATATAEKGTGATAKITRILWATASEATGGSENCSAIRLA